MLRFWTSTDKKIQAVAVLLMEEGGTADLIRVLKLLYIADREALAERASPIVGGRVVAMKNGPLHSEVYDLMKGEHDRNQDWSQFFSRSQHSLTLIGNPGRLELSPYEIEKLVEVSNRYRQVDSWSIADETHGFQEYIDRYKPDTSQTIPADFILRTLGFSPDEIARIIREAESGLKLAKETERNCDKHSVA
jgi:uncharacterized phage-associated protein